VITIPGTSDHDDRNTHNPDEQVWNHLKGRLANGSPLSTEELMRDLSAALRRARRSPALLRGFILESDLPPFLSS